MRGHFIAKWKLFRFIVCGRVIPLCVVFGNSHRDVRCNDYITPSMVSGDPVERVIPYMRDLRQSLLRALRVRVIPQQLRGPVQLGAACVSRNDYTTTAWSLAIGEET